jgi:quercetin dioxygenase-like cupin family protein
MLGNSRRKISFACALCGAFLMTAAALGTDISEPVLAKRPAALVTPLLSSGKTVVGEALSYPVGAAPKVTAAIVALEPGAETGWHMHGVPTFGYLLEGELTVDYGPEGRRIYRAGDALLEAIDISHNGRNTGTGTMRILAVFIGAEGLKTTIPAPKN